MEDDIDDELSVNIANTLIEHSYYDLKKLATDLKIEFDSDYSQEEYGNGPIQESKPIISKNIHDIEKENLM